MKLKASTCHSKVKLIDKYVNKQILKKLPPALASADM